MEINPNMFSEEIIFDNINIVKSSIEKLSEKEKANLGVDTEFGTVMHNIKEQIMKTNIAVNINIDEIKAVFIVDFYFKIKNLNKFCNINEKNQIVFSPSLLDTLLDLSYGTMRGIVFEKLYKINNMRTIILPLMDFTKRKR